MQNFGIPLLDNNGIYAQAFIGCCNNQLASGLGKSPKQIGRTFFDTFRISGVSPYFHIHYLLDKLMSLSI